MKYVLIALMGYLIGSFSMSIILTRYFLKDDVRNHGSGNAGATNVARVFGWGPGILTFLCDFLKCLAAFLLGRHFGGEWGAFFGAAACIAGHCFPLYFGFRGGKAVTTGACIALMIDPKLFLTAIAVFAIAFLLTHIVSVSSLSAAAALIITAMLLDLSLPMRLLAVYTGIFIIVMHHENIRRLMDGTETKFTAGKRKSGK